jgi:membrane protease YdiL (CAAX protease family)
MSDASSEPTKPARQHLPWGPLAAITVTAISYIGAQFAAALALGLLFGVFGQQSDIFDTIFGQFTFVVVTDALILATLWLFVRRRHASFRLLGLMRRPHWGDVGSAILAYLAYFGILIVVMALARLFLPIDVDQEQELGFENLVSTPQKLMALVSLVLLPPIVEEIVFRGFLYTGLRKRLPFVEATIITSLLFAAPHLLASSDGLLWVAGIDTLLLSVILCHLREKTGALWAPMMVHGLKNGVAFIMLLSSFAATQTGAIL